jgi:hypothetical protein
MECSGYGSVDLSGRATKGFWFSKALSFLKKKKQKTFEFHWQRLD